MFVSSIVVRGGGGVSGGRTVVGLLFAVHRDAGVLQILV